MARESSAVHKDEHQELHCFSIWGYQLAHKERHDTTFAFRTEDMLTHRRESLEPTREDTCFCLSTFVALRGYTDNQLEMSFGEINIYEVILRCSWCSREMVSR